MFPRKSNSPPTLQLTLLLALLINHNHRSFVICSNNFSQNQGQSSNSQVTSTNTTTESPRYIPSQSGYSDDDFTSSHSLSPQLSSSSSSSSSLPSASHSIKESRRSSPLHYGLITPRNDLLMAANANSQQQQHHHYQQQQLHHHLQQQQQQQQPFMVRTGFGLHSGDFHANGGVNGNQMNLHQSSSPLHHSGSANFYSQRDLSSAGSTPADYTTSGAGFLMPDLQSEATSNRLYDLALASSENERIKATLSGRVRSSNGLSSSSGLSAAASSTSGSSASPSDYSALDNNPSVGSSSSSQAESELANYLKAAASEAAASSSSPSAGGSSENTNQLVPNSPNLVGRRKPLYAERVVEEQHIFDPAVTKHLLQKQRENEYAANNLMESGLSAESPVPSESDLAQQLAAMSELHSNHPGSSSPSEYLPLSSSGLSLNPNSFSSMNSINEYSALGGAGGHNGAAAAAAAGLRGFSNLGGLSGLGGQGLATSASSLPSMITPYALAAANSLPRSPAGVPAGAIVGAPGSAPPPGMKLAGYVTMTNPSPPMMSPQVSSSMVNPMALMAQNMGNNPGQSMGGGPGMGNLAGGMSNNQAQAVAQMMAQGMGQGMGQGMSQAMNQAMGQGMGQGMKYPFNPMAFGPGAAGQNQALQALLGGAMGQVGQQASQVSATTSSPASASAGSAAASTAPSSSSSGQSRNRFFSRLNPLNLFRRFRIRGNSAGSTSTEPSVAEAEKRSSVVSEYFSQGQQRFNRFPFNQHVGPHYTLYPYDQHSAFHHSRRARRSADEISKDHQEQPLASETNSSQNDTETAENYYPFPGNYFMPASGGRMRFPNSEGRRRGSRRYSGPGYLSSVESRGLGLMGSGNFEVIRGGILPGNNKRTLRPHSSMSNERDNDDRNDSGYSDEDDSNNHNNNNHNNNSDDDKSSSYPPLEDEFFSAGSPGILGFQGFNHFSGSSSSVFNNLSASRRKSAILSGEKGSEALASEKSSTSTDLQAIS
ncbi:neurogenic protein mastermind-like [Panonychus citri]|uniref:neurogenic protein mastermind-like n=1 Tax=Panonychus citri TaxID=50023 RepID=UPI00230817C9|nr:neurogenic protein mastermind-like [Panonychus citri]